MSSPLVVSDISNPSTMLGLHGGRGTNRWKRFVTGLMLHADWDSFEHNQLDPGSAIGEHVHTRTEEIYFIVSGSARMTLNGKTFEVAPGDLIMTPLGGRHSIENTGDEMLEFVVVEALPPSIVELLPAYTPSAASEGASA